MAPTTIYNKFSEVVDNTVGRSPELCVKTTEQHAPFGLLKRSVDDLSLKLLEVLPPTQTRDHKPVVGLFMTNGITYIKSVLACSKAGFVFLPIPKETTPKEKLTFILRDACVDLLLTEEGHLEATKTCQEVMKSAELCALNYYGVVGFISGDATERVQTNDTTDVCYFMYTSGTTGKPKGVAITNGNLDCLLEGEMVAWDVKPNDVVLQHAPIGFDASIAEMTMSLMGGTHLAVILPHQRKGEEFIAAVDELRATVAIMTPATLRVYTPELMPKHIRVLVSAGEACDVGLARKWSQRGERTFCNGYGPTEGTVCSTSFTFFPEQFEESSDSDPLPIGLPILNVEVRLVAVVSDNIMVTPPAGTEGEILIGGPNVAKGYIGHAARFNAEKFIVMDGRRWYRTGDYAVQPEEDLEEFMMFSGRKDDQVKVGGGIRVGLLEVETAIKECADVSQVAVVNHKCGQCTVNTLVAYVVRSHDQQRVTSAGIRAELETVLSSYAVPTHIIIRDEPLPVSANGKIHRSQLSVDSSIHTIPRGAGVSTAAVGPSLSRSITPPEPPAALVIDPLRDMEEKMTAIYEEILGTRPPSVHVSFAKMGGTSIQHVLLQQALRSKFNVSIPIQTIQSGTQKSIIEFSRDVVNVLNHDNVDQDEKDRQQMLRDSYVTNLCIPEERGCAPEEIETILMTGATGFLGAYLLEMLVARIPRAKIICLVRHVTSNKDAMIRVVKNLTTFDRDKTQAIAAALSSKRIRAIPGDVSEPRLGLSVDKLDYLRDNVDVIVCAGAAMNFSRCYQWHYDTNVYGTKQLLNLALSGTKLKHFYFVSTMAVALFPAHKGVRAISSYDSLDDPINVEGGYARSKWVAEKLVMGALPFLPGGCVFRPTRLFASSTGSAILSRNDFIKQLYLGILDMGSSPDINVHMINLVPVDVCAALIAVTISKRVRDPSASTHKRVLNICNPHPMTFNEMFERDNLPTLPLDQWTDSLSTEDAIDKDTNPLYSMRGYLLSNFWTKAASGYWPEEFLCEPSDVALYPETSKEMWFSMFKPIQRLSDSEYMNNQQNY